MTNAGWYPDPAGAPDTYRYWDGQSWSQMTTSHPPAAEQQAPPQAPQQPQQPTPPAAAATQFPPQPPTPAPGYGYGQQQWSPMPSGGSSGGGSGKTIGIVIAAVLTLVLLGVGGFFGVRALTGDDDGDKSAADPTSESSSDETDSTEGSDPTESGDPTELPTNSVAPTGIQCTGGAPEPASDPGATPATITGGGLTIPVPTGYTVDVRLSPPHSFADGVLVAYKSIEENWITEFAVGGLPRANGFNDVADAAEIIMKCLTANDSIYEGFSERKDLTSEAITVGGKPAYRITSEIRVDNPKVVAEGDVTTVIVVDTGGTSYGLFLGVATIGEPTSIALVESQIKAIKVG